MIQTLCLLVQRVFFDGAVAQSALEEAQGQLDDEINNVKSQVNSLFGGDLSGSGGLDDGCIDVRGQQVCFGLLKWAGDLSIIGNVIFFLAVLMSIEIIARR